MFFYTPRVTSSMGNTLSCADYRGAGHGNCILRQSNAPDVRGAAYARERPRIAGAAAL